MKISQRTVQTLKPFKQLSDSVIIDTTSRFCIFGKGKDNQYNSLVVEGYINEKVSDYGHYSLSEIDNRNLISIPLSNASSDPQKKLQYFDDLFLNATKITSFFLSEQNLKKLCSAKNATHIRLWGKKQGDVFGRSFDARKYYEKILATERDKYELCTLEKHDGNEFTVYSELGVFKNIQKDSYEVTVYDIGIFILNGLEHNMTYYIRDQRLGKDWSEEIENSVLKETVLLFHPKRVKAIRNKMKTQN